MSKNFFTVQMFTHWERFPKEAMESPSLEVFQNLDTILSNVL